MTVYGKRIAEHYADYCRACDRDHVEPVAPEDFNVAGWLDSLECLGNTFAFVREVTAHTRPDLAANDRIGDKQQRKNTPVATGVIDYFPDALIEVGALSFIGNEQHNPGTPLHWDRSKSGDESDALIRHFIDRGTRDSDGVRHSAKVAWRALALLQKEIEADRGSNG